MNKLTGQIPLWLREKQGAFNIYLYDEDMEKEIVVYTTPLISVMHIGLIRALEECRPSHCLSVRHE